MAHFFKGTKEKPYHLSVGAVFINDEGLVCCHYFKDFKNAAAQNIKI